MLFSSRPIEGLFHLLALATLCSHFESECTILSACSQVGWVVALIVGAQKEGLRIP